MLAAWILRYGYAVIFVATAVEGDATLLAATYLAHRGYLQLDRVIEVAAVATIVGNQIYFWLGRRYGSTRLRRVARRPFQARLIDLLRKYRLPLVLASRFVYGGRIAIPVASGATDMPPLTFSLADGLGAIVWSVVVGFCGYA